MSKVNILTFADGNYLQHACVLLMSLKDVASPQRKYHVYLYYTNCNDEDLEKVENSLLGYFPANITYELRECNFGLETEISAKQEYMTSSIYDKILLYEELPSELEKVVFFDADIVLLKDPAELFDMEVESYVVAAVHDQVYDMKFSQKAKEVMGVGKDNYFNSGVMLVNLQKWRELNISERALQFCIDNWDLTPYHDQDGLNFAVKGQWLEISHLWNPRVENVIRNDNGAEQLLTREQVYERNLSYLVHFSGPQKPWFYMGFHPKKRIYLKYLRMSEFRDYKFPDYSLKNVLRRQVLSLRREGYYLRKRLQTSILAFLDIQPDAEEVPHETS